MVLLKSSKMLKKHLKNQKRKNKEIKNKIRELIDEYHKYEKKNKLLKK